MPVPDPPRIGMLPDFKAIRLAYQDSALSRAGVIAPSTIQPMRGASLGSSGRPIPSDVLTVSNSTNLNSDQHLDQYNTFSNLTILESDQDAYYYNILGLSLDVLLIEFIVSISAFLFFSFFSPIIYS